MTTNLPVATEIIPMVLQLQPAMSTTGYAYALTEDQYSVERRKKFAPICPEFVIELRSESVVYRRRHRLQVLQDKMQEYINNGTQLGWLIDRKQHQVFIYRPNIPIEILDNPNKLSGEPLLPGFVLDLSQV